MCGITGYIGKDPALSFVMQGLQKLEYRGYDSAGVTLVDEKGLSTFKTKGRLSELEKLLEDKTCPQVCGIGHTRWATHGVPSQLNSHPHSNQKNTISLVHNGIIENYASLKETLLKKGYSFQSETDTEIVVNLLDDYYYNDTNDLFEALKKTLKGLEGSFALCIVSTVEPDTIYVAKKESPMVLGKTAEASFCASDAPALLAYTKRFLPLEDGQIAALIKPQFEAGRELVGKKGVVRDPSVHEDVIRGVCSFVPTLGLTVLGLTYSPVRGPEGNIEYLLYLSCEKGAASSFDAENCIKDTVAQAHAKLDRDSAEEDPEEGG